MMKKNKETIILNDARIVASALKMAQAYQEFEPDDTMPIEQQYEQVEGLYGEAFANLEKNMKTADHSVVWALQRAAKISLGLKRYEKQQGALQRQGKSRRKA